MFVSSRCVSIAATRLVLQERHELSEFVQLILGQTHLMGEVTLFFLNLARLHHRPIYDPTSFDGNPTRFLQR